MPVPQIPPGWGGHVPHVHFCYTGTPCGAKWKAWVAGPAIWLIGHTKRPTKPCLDVMTLGALLCPRCAKGEEPRKVGYQPLYRFTDGKPVVILLYEEEEQHTKAFVTHQGVMVAREEEKSDSVFVRGLMGEYPKYQTSRFERTRPVDCTESLLSMWSIPEWSMWCRGSTVKLNREPLPTGDAPVKTNGEVYSETMKAAARRWAPPPAVESNEAADGIQAAIDRAALKAAQTSSSNGKHKPKG